MKPFHRITVFFVSEREKADFSETGVEFTVTRGSRGECIIFEIGEDDPRWERVMALVGSLKGKDQIPQKYRVQNLSMTKATLRVSAISSFKESQSGKPGWLNGHAGKTAEGLLALEGSYRIDSLVAAFEQAISQNAKRDESQGLTVEERTVLAVEAVEREVNNGGYDLFFANAPLFASTVVDSLRSIGCKKTANITQRAIQALGVSELTVKAIGAAMATEDRQRQAKFGRCNDSYYKCAEPIAERLFSFIKNNRVGIRF